MSRPELEQIVNRAFDAHYVCLVRYAYRATGSLEFAEDAVQAAFLLFYRALAAGGKIFNEKAWLMCVTRREARRMVERQRRDCSLAGGSQALDDVVAPMPEPVEPAFAADTVLPLLALLTPREEEVLHLRLSSMKYKEIAAELGITIPTVNTLLARAVEKLKRALRPGESPAKPAKAVKEGHASRRVQ